MAALPALAQQPGGVRRIGYFTLGTTQSSATWLAAFRSGMTALRWVEGRDYTLAARYAEGVAQAGPGLAAELVATNMRHAPLNVPVRMLKASARPPQRRRA